MHLSVAPIRACDRCWSPHPPMCPSCMESMKLKKARALDPEARWHPTRAADDVSEEALKRMSQDAFKGPCGRVSGYSRLSDLFGDIDAESWNDTPVRNYLESMTRRSHQANALATATTADGHRWADAALRERCAKLIEELPDKSVEKHNLTSESSAEERWAAVARLVTQYIGEVHILQPESATWKLCEVHQWNGLSENLLERQFQIQLDGGPEDFASKWLGHKAKIGLDWQVRTTATDKHIDQAALWPCWAKQTMRVVAPVTHPEAVSWLGPKSIRLASGHASAIREETMFQCSGRARPGSRRIVVLHVVMRGRFMPRSSHAHLCAGLVVAHLSSSTPADG